jgi:pyruvate/2-oxoglutarate dehydrogenase complex dihydrolipoamide dehydrogenase (E3) component
MPIGWGICEENIVSKDKPVIEFDVAVIGAGQAGPTIAIALARRGEKVALIEGGLVGGSCVNYGCTPTKTLRKSARVAHLVRRAGDFGIHAGTVEVDFAATMERMQQRVDESRVGLEESITGQDGLSLLRGWGVFAGRAGDRFELTAGDQTLRAARVFLNTGTRARIPPLPGINDVPHLDNISLLRLRERPRHLIIIGGSYIGLEMGQIFRRLGSEVTVIEAGPRITGHENEAVSMALTEMMQAESIRICTGNEIEQVQMRSGDGIAVKVGGQLIEGSHLLVATGRNPNTERLNLAAVGVETDAHGFVPTNGRLETNVPGIWAVGDINKRGAFTHTSYQDGQIVLANLKGGARTSEGRVTTYAMYTDPPLGRVGLSEREAHDSGRPMLVANFQMKDVSRAKEESETAGLMQILVDQQSEEIVGASLLGFGCDEVIQVISNFMATGARYQVLRDALPIHPTVAEFLPFLLDKLEPLKYSSLP